MTGDGSSASVEPGENQICSSWTNAKAMTVPYQSIDCGGSSFECEVLTVSTQPIRNADHKPLDFDNRYSSTIHAMAITKVGTNLGWVAFPASSRMPSMR